MYTNTHLRANTQRHTEVNIFRVAFARDSKGSRAWSVLKHDPPFRRSWTFSKPGSFDLFAEKLSCKQADAQKLRQLRLMKALRHLPRPFVLGKLSVYSNGRIYKLGKFFIVLLYNLKKNYEKLSCFDLFLNKIKQAILTIVYGFDWNIRCFTTWKKKLQVFSFYTEQVVKNVMSHRLAQ